MNMIEVDPKLFVKCRLCLDETGQYQIVPNVQMQIKYCFDIDVEPFDGLPQLVCKKCESILSQYSGIKQIFQEKQKNLKSKLNSNVKIDNIIQQQQDIVSSTQADTDKTKLDTITEKAPNKTTQLHTRCSSTETVVPNCRQRRYKKIVQNKNINKIWQNKYTKCFVCRFCGKSLKDKRGFNGHIHKQCKMYKKYANINRSFCLVELNKIEEKPNITGSLDNVVCDKSKIIQSRKANYYILYSNRSNDQHDASDSTDEDFVFDVKKRKRPRLISRSSSDTIVLEQNIARSSDVEKVTKVKKSDERKITEKVSDIECVNIEDSDSNSAKSSVKLKHLDTVNPKKITTINDKMVNNIIAMCFAKYMDRLNESEEGKTMKGKEVSFLKRKVLSIGRKVINSSGVNTTGLLKYMEHKNLEVVWVPKMESKVIIKTRTKESGDNDNSNFGWDNITSLPNHNHVTEDFALAFERISALEINMKNNSAGNQLNKDYPELQRNVTTDAPQEKPIVNFGIGVNRDSRQKRNTNDKIVDNTLIGDSVSEKDSVQSSNDGKANDNIYLRAVLDADKNWKKLLNANPVANPKQLPKKNTCNETASIVKLYSNDSINDSNVIEQSNTEKNNILHMPVITSTVSLAPEKNIVEHVNHKANESKIDNKPLVNMPKIKVKPVSELMPDKAQNNSFASAMGWTINHNSSSSNTSQNVVLHTNDNNIVYLATGSFPHGIPVQQDIMYYPQRLASEPIEINPVVNPLLSKQLPQKEYVRLHTVELPNTRSDSPFQYFQKLLQFHNIHLLESLETLSNSMKCLTKFKVLFEQEVSSPVQLCLILFCENNMFCIKAKDHLLKELDIVKFSPNWQWEILKVFKGDDVVPKILTSAIKFGTPMYDYTTLFTNLLKSIVFSKGP